MLEGLLVRGDAPPWNALPAPVLVYPALMVHRVDGLERVCTCSCEIRMPCST